MRLDSHFFGSLPLPARADLLQRVPQRRGLRFWAIEPPDQIVHPLQDRLLSFMLLAITVIDVLNFRTDHSFLFFVEPNKVRPLIFRYELKESCPSSNSVKRLLSVRAMLTGNQCKIANEIIFMR